MPTIHHRTRPLRRALPLALLAGALDAPPASAQPAAAEGRGAAGAALCVAVGEIGAARPGADSTLGGGVAAWRQILNVVEPDPARAEAALTRAREGLASLERVRERAAAGAAETAWLTCASRDSQLSYLKQHANGDRVWTALAAAPGTVLPPGQVERLSAAAACAAIAAVVARPTPTPEQRAGYAAATPAFPDAAELAAIGVRARAELGAIPGSDAGKALLVDYLRAPLEREEPEQARVDRMSGFLRDSCLAPAARF